MEKSAILGQHSDSAAEDVRQQLEAPADIKDVGLWFVLLCVLQEKVPSPTAPTGIPAPTPQPYRSPNRRVPQSTLAPRRPTAARPPQGATVYRQQRQQQHQHPATIAATVHPQSRNQPSRRINHHQQAMLAMFFFFFFLPTPAPTVSFSNRRRHLQQQQKVQLVANPTAPAGLSQPLHLPPRRRSSTSQPRPHPIQPPSIATIDRSLQTPTGTAPPAALAQHNLPTSTISPPRAPTAPRQPHSSLEEYTVPHLLVTAWLHFSQPTYHHHNTTMTFFFFFFFL